MNKATNKPMSMPEDGINMAGVAMDLSTLKFKAAPALLMLLIMMSLR